MYKSRIHTTPNQYTQQEMTFVEESAKSLEDKMRLFFFCNQGVNYSAEDLHKQFGGLLTSVRRSLTNLANANIITKDIDNKKMGSNGVRIVTYIMHVNLQGKEFNDLLK